MEHIGDVTTNGTVVGKDFLKDPGLHRTPDGRRTRNLIRRIRRWTCQHHVFGEYRCSGHYKELQPASSACDRHLRDHPRPFGKVGAILQTIPGPVKGGVEVMLFGMIAAVGIRSLAESDLDFTHSRNLTIVGLILVFGLGFAQMGGLNVHAGSITLNISGLFIAVVIGVLMNIILPQAADTVKKPKKGIHIPWNIQLKM